MEKLLTPGRVAAKIFQLCMVVNDILKEASARWEITINAYV